MRLVANGPGLGDAIVLTCVLRELIRQRPAVSVAVSAAFPAVFSGWANVESVEPWAGPEARSFPELDHMAGRTEHQVVTMCRKLGLQPPDRASIIPHVLCARGVQAPIGLPPPGSFVTLSTTPGRWAHQTKAWPYSRWQALVDELFIREIKTVQVGGYDDPPLARVAAAYLGEPIPLVARILADALVHVAPVTGTMHLATAVGTPVVCLYGGREDPLVTGYARNANLGSVLTLGCSPCWRLDCKHASSNLPAPCMSEVSVEAVWQAVARMAEGVWPVVHMAKRAWSVGL